MGDHICIVDACTDMSHNELIEHINAINVTAKAFMNAFNVCCGPLLCDVCLTGFLPHDKMLITSIEGNIWDGMRFFYAGYSVMMLRRIKKEKTC